MDFTFGGKHRLEEELAIGGCGIVFYGVHKVAGKEVVIKLKLKPVVEKQPSPLQHESRIYKTLMGGPGMPWMIWSGKQGDYNVMVIDPLSPSLEDLFKLCSRHFSLKTVLLLAGWGHDLTPNLYNWVHFPNSCNRGARPARSRVQ